VIGCDIVVTTNADSLSKMAAGRTAAVVNSHVAPTSEFATNPDLDLSSRKMEDAIRGAVAGGPCEFVAATRLATALCGDAIYTNPFLMGFAYQKGWLPVGRGALERAFALNGARREDEPARVRLGPASRPRSRRGRRGRAARAARVAARGASPRTSNRSSRAASRS
jgi:indolepyruvate ferredoxin oxidoreductase